MRAQELILLQLPKAKLLGLFSLEIPLLITRMAPFLNHLCILALYTWFCWILLSLCGSPAHNFQDEEEAGGLCGGWEGWKERCSQDFLFFSGVRLNYVPYRGVLFDARLIKVSFQDQTFQETNSFLSNQNPDFQNGNEEHVFSSLHTLE